MRVIELIGDVSWNFPLEWYRHSSESVVYNLVSLLSGHIILYSRLGFDETGLSSILGILSSREQK